MKYFITSLGCKLNQSEAESLARQLAAAGHTIVDKPQRADWCVVNTCLVTHIAARKSRQLIRRLHRENPAVHIAVTGCYAEVSPDEIAALGNVDIIASNQEKEHLASLIDRVSAEATPEAFSSEPRVGPRGSIETPRTRAFVKIQAGCDNHCTYCIVTIARGPQRSRPETEILAEISSRVQEGYKEVVLTGVHIGSYGQDHQAKARGEKETNLRELVRLILQETEIQRLRLSSVEPWDFDPELLSLWKDSRLCRHLHLPLQSGCDATLHRMGRRYTQEQYEASVAAARQAIPGLAVTTDVIVGFPGETEEEFTESLAFVKKLAFARLHVFKYSQREQTVAANMPDQVSPGAKRARSQAMLRIGKQSAHAFARGFRGKTLSVLWEHPLETSTRTLWRGLTDNYIRVYARGYARARGGSPCNLHNAITHALLQEPFRDGVLGEVIV